MCSYGSEFILLALADSPWKVHLSNVSPEMTGVTVRGLTPARTYQFRVCAVNQVGKGQYSTETSRCVSVRPSVVAGAARPGQTQSTQSGGANSTREPPAPLREVGHSEHRKSCNQGRNAGPHGRSWGIFPNRSEGSFSHFRGTRAGLTQAIPDRTGLCIHARHS